MAGLEFLRTDWDWKLGGLPTAVIIGIAVALLGVVWLIYNHPRGKAPYPYLPPWTATDGSQPALALATAGGGAVALGAAANVGESSDGFESDDEEDDDDFEDTDTDNDEPDDSANEASEDF